MFKKHREASVAGVQGEGTGSNRRRSQREDSTRPQTAFESRKSLETVKGPKAKLLWPIYTQVQQDLLLKY